MTARELLSATLLTGTSSTKFEVGHIMCITALRRKSTDGPLYRVDCESHETLETDNIEEALDYFMRLWKPST